MADAITKIISETRNAKKRMEQEIAVSSTSFSECPCPPANKLFLFSSMPPPVFVFFVFSCQNKISDSACFFLFFPLFSSCLRWKQQTATKRICRWRTAGSCADRAAIPVCYTRKTPEKTSRHLHFRFLAWIKKAPAWMECRLPVTAAPVHRLPRKGKSDEMKQYSYLQYACRQERNRFTSIRELPRLVAACATDIAKIF